MAQQPEYVPDFVVETAHYLLIPHDLVTQDKRQIDFPDVTSARARMPLQAVAARPDRAAAGECWPDR